MNETKEFRQSYLHHYKSRPLLWENVDCDILQYIGTKEDPQWLDEEPGNFMTLCSIAMDGRSAAKLATQHVNSNGSTYYKLEFDIVLRFGLTELEAQFVWDDNVRFFFFSSYLP